MEDNKKKKGGRAYLNDFKTTLSGEYIYTGATYLPQGDYKKTRLWLAVLSGLCVALNLLCGSVPAEPMLNTFYALIPFAVSLICSIRVLWAVMRLCANRPPLREYVLRQTFDKIRPFSLATAVASAATVLATVIFGAVTGFSGLSYWTVIFLISQLFVIFSGLFLSKITKKLSWNKQ